jgi:hypothetical protein
LWNVYAFDDVDARMKIGAKRELSDCRRLGQGIKFKSPRLEIHRVHSSGPRSPGGDWQHRAPGLHADGEVDGACGEADGDECQFLGFAGRAGKLARLEVRGYKQWSRIGDVVCVALF